MQRTIPLVILAIGALSVGCLDGPISSPTAPAMEQKSVADGATPDGDDFELPEFPPADQFVAKVTNRYFPLAPGTVFRYRGETEEGLETIVTKVTHDTKTILGIVATVVHDRSYLDGELTEETFDWYAQDRDGNVWYLGEFATFYEDGEPAGHEGSWEAGVDGASPGIVMLARPRVGITYQQENASGVSEDRATIVARHATIRVRYDKFKNVLVTLETSPLDPDAGEYKFYAPGVGFILEAERRSGRGEHVELISINGNRRNDDDGDCDDDIVQLQSK